MIKDLGIHNPHYIGSKMYIKNSVEYREHLFNRSLPSDEAELEKAVKQRFPHCRIALTTYNSQSKVLGIATVRVRD